MQFNQFPTSWRDRNLKQMLSATTVQEMYMPLAGEAERDMACNGQDAETIMSHVRLLAECALHDRYAPYYKVYPCMEYLLAKLIDRKLEGQHLLLPTPSSLRQRPTAR